jgi:outer membrane protein OmpA-like peptidoglycan-associated protein
MSLNVMQRIQSALTEGVVQQLAVRLGLSSTMTQKVLTAAGPALIAGLMQKSTTLDGARSLFTAILSPDVNGSIAEQLPQLLDSTVGMNQLENVGRQLLERVLGRRVDRLSDELATQTGVPAHATHAITGVAGATLLCVLKHHFLDGRGNVGQLPSLFAHQLPLIEPHLTDNLLAAVGVAGLGAFTGNILPQLKAVAAHIDQPTPAARPLSDALASVSVPAGAVQRSERRSHKWLWWLLAAIAAVLALLCQRGCHSEQGADVSGARARATTAAAAQPAVGATSAGASSAAVAASDASETAAASAPAMASASASVSASAPAPASAPVASIAPTQDSQLTVAVDATGKPTLTATVGSEAEKARLIDELTKRLGAAHFIPNITVDQNVKPADWLTHLDGLIPLLSLPGAQLKVDGTHIELGGSAAKADSGWLDKLKALFGTPYEIGSFDVEHAIADANENFRSAIKSLLTPESTCSAADIVKVLNLQVINFGNASARVPASAAQDLEQSARLLNACAHNGKTVRLEVSGYSDNVGGTQANLQLSKLRAQAVRAYLVRHGVSADSLISQGYGDADPVASNDTESGRFANRRIQFVAQQSQE